MKTLADSACQSEIRDRLALLCEADFALWGRMSCPQMLCHLHGAFQMVLQEISIKPVKSWLRGPHGRFLALYSGMPWGKDISTVPELDVVRTGSFFPGSAIEIVDIFGRFYNASAEELAPMHPMFGRMSRGDWMRWGYLHTDHHLRQFGR